jgi:glycosyltransferase involved in cell wall biosynthesis
VKIAFATIGDARDIRRGSGTPYYLSRELQKQGHLVEYVGSLVVNPPVPTRAFKFISKKMKRGYRSFRDPFMGRKLGIAVEQKLAGKKVDVLLTNDYCIAGYTKVNFPIVLYTDDTFPYDYSQNVHPDLVNLSFMSVHFCQLTLRKGLLGAKKSIFASRFASQQAEKYRPGNYPVIPYGANIDPPEKISPKKIESICQKGALDLLFIGKNWEGKGGAVAVRITNLLNARGFSSRLHVVGVDTQPGGANDFVTYYGLLNKGNPEDLEKLHQLYAICDVLVVPSKAEGYGLAFVEAAAYGMPSLAYATTGVITAVQSGKSGILFDPKEGEDAFVHQVESWFENPETYESLSRGARAFYEQSANWQAAVARLSDEFLQIVLQ